jgi:uncharacterized Zn ribbon protein
MEGDGVKDVSGKELKKGDIVEVIYRDHLLFHQTNSTIYVKKLELG